jgi:hypothetical protein
MTEEKTQEGTEKTGKKLTRGREITKPGTKSTESDRWRNNLFRFLSVYFVLSAVAEINPMHPQIGNRCALRE